LSLSVRGPVDNEKRRGTDFDDDYRFIPVRRSLADNELKAAANWILQNIAMPPISFPAYCPSCGDPPHTAVVRLEIVLEGVQLSRDGPERIIGRISGNDTSCIVVGTSAKGQFHLEWVSPLLEPRSQVLAFRDVNADGVGEIWSFSSVRSTGEEVWGLSIFDLQGRELTRDSGECDWAVTSALAASPLAAACPIIGLPGIGYFVGNDGKVTLEAARDFRNNPEPRRLYQFVGDKYIWVKSTAHSRIK